MESTEEKKRKIHIMVGYFRVPMRIDLSEEIIYRNAEKVVNKLLTETHKTYPLRSEEEILCLSLYNIAVALVKTEMNPEVAPLAESISKWNEEIDKLFEIK